MRNEFETNGLPEEAVCSCLWSKK